MACRRLRQLPGQLTAQPCVLQLPPEGALPRLCNSTLAPGAAPTLLRLRAPSCPPLCCHFRVTATDASCKVTPETGQGFCTGHTEAQAVRAERVPHATPLPTSSHPHDVDPPLPDPHRRRGSQKRPASKASGQSQGPASLRPPMPLPGIRQEGSHPTPGAGVLPIMLPSTCPGLPSLCPASHASWPHTRGPGRT